MTEDLYLSLGTNIGDRKANLDEALSMLDGTLGVHYDKVSSFIETEPWGFECDDRFVNAVVRYRLDVPRGTDICSLCYSILHKCKEIEVLMGRTGNPEYDENGNRVYRSRIIDIDILRFGDFEMNEDDLKIPHPLMYERDFVMVPLMEICNGKF